MNFRRSHALPSPHRFRISDVEVRFSTKSPAPPEPSPVFQNGGAFPPSAASWNQAGLKRFSAEAPRTPFEETYRQHEAALAKLFDAYPTDQGADFNFRQLMLVEREFDFATMLHRHGRVEEARSHFERAVQITEEFSQDRRMRTWIRRTPNAKTFLLCSSQELSALFSARPDLIPRYWEQILKLLPLVSAKCLERFVEGLFHATESDPRLQTHLYRRFAAEKPEIFAEYFSCIPLSRKNARIFWRQLPKESRIPRLEIYHAFAEASEHLGPRARERLSEAYAWEIRRNKDNGDIGWHQSALTELWLTSGIPALVRKGRKQAERLAEECLLSPGKPSRTHFFTESLCYRLLTLLDHFPKKQRLGLLKKIGGVPLESVPAKLRPAYFAAVLRLDLAEIAAYFQDSEFKFWLCLLWRIIAERKPELWFNAGDQTTIFLEALGAYAEKYRRPELILLLEKIAHSWLQGRERRADLSWEPSERWKLSDAAQLIRTLKVAAEVRDRLLAHAIGELVLVPTQIEAFCEELQRFGFVLNNRDFRRSEILLLQRFHKASALLKKRPKPLKKI